MDSDIIKTLKVAADTLQEVKIVYNAGSQPGTLRSIKPQIVSDEEVRAICLKSHETKTFKVEKISLPKHGRAYTNYDPENFYVDNANLVELLEPHMEELQITGFTIEQSDTSISLYEHFKNGKRKKTPSIYLYFVDANEFFGSPERPWYVKSKQHVSGRAYKNLRKAVDTFMGFVRDYSAKNTIMSAPRP